MYQKHLPTHNFVAESSPVVVKLRDVYTKFEIGRNFSEH